MIPRPEATSSRGSRRESPLRILLLAHRPLDEVHSGGGQRTKAIHQCLAGEGLVHTLVIRGGAEFSTTERWDATGVRTLVVAEGARLPTRVRDRARARRWIKGVLDEGAYDVVVARYISLASLVPFSVWPRLIIDADDIVKRAQGDGPIGWDGIPSVMRRTARRSAVRVLLSRAGHTWFVSPRDMLELGPVARHSSILPNTANDYSTTDRRPVPGTILVVGHYSHWPNEEGVNYYIESVLPRLRAARPDVRLRIVGQIPDPCRIRWGGIANVEVVGFVDDLAAEYAAASMAIAPVVSGGGTQLKLIEALTNGVPIVASGFTAGGLGPGVLNRVHLCVADTADEWVDACLDLLDHSDQAAEMGRRAKKDLGPMYGRDAMRSIVASTVSELLDRTHRS